VGAHHGQRARTVALVLSLAVAAGLAAGCAGKDTNQTSTTTGAPPPTETTTTTEAPLDAGKQMFVYVPSTGDCFDKRKVPGQGNKQTEIVLKLDCTLPHQYEVFGVVDYVLPDPKDTAYPGDEILRKFAKVECPKLYEAYVGQAYELSKYEIGYVIPPEANWPSNRKVGCTVVDSTGNRLGAPVKNSKT
jgi:hypothetical protein